MNGFGRPANPARGIGDPLIAFSRGEIGRRRAMDALGIGHGELLDRLADRRLPLPQLPEAELERMVAVMLDVLERAGRRIAGSSSWLGREGDRRIRAVRAPMVVAAPHAPRRYFRRGERRPGVQVWPLPDAAGCDEAGAGVRHPGAAWGTARGPCSFKPR